MINTRVFGFIGMVLGVLGITAFAYLHKFWWWFIAVLVLWAGIRYFTKEEATP